MSHGGRMGGGNNDRQGVQSYWRQLAQRRRKEGAGWGLRRLKFASIGQRKERRVTGKKVEGLLKCLLCDRDKRKFCKKK